MHFLKTRSVKRKLERCTTLILHHIISLLKVGYSRPLNHCTVFLELADGTLNSKVVIVVDNSVCDKITEVTETERTRREYEDSIKRRHNRLMEFVDTHVKDDQIKKYIRVSIEDQFIQQTFFKYSGLCWFIVWPKSKSKSKS